MSDLPSLRQLAYFLALAETGHFRKAAEREGISQPSLSVQVANLEERLGLVLVERGRGRVVLTAAGREVAERARAMLSDARALLDLSATMRSGLGGTIRFGASATLGPYLLPRVVGELHQRYPELSLYVREGPPRTLLDDLMRGEHDLALVQLPIADAEVSILRLFREPLAIAVARDHRIAERDVATREDLAGEAVLTLGASFSLHQQVLALCEQTGARLLRSYEGTSLDALRLMAGMGMGIAILPALYVRSEIGPHVTDVKVLRLEQPRVTRSIGLVARKGPAGAFAQERIAEAIRAVVREHYRDVLTLES